MASRKKGLVELNDAEQDRLRKFHKKQTKGSLVVKFSNTEIGVRVQVKMTGQKKWVDITDYESW